jgi:hypothetical protein
MTTTRPTIAQLIEAQAPHCPPPTPRNQIYLTEAEAKARIAGAVFQWLPVPHYFDTDYYVDQHDIDRVAAVIRRIGRQGHLRFDE